MFEVGDTIIMRQTAETLGINAMVPYLERPAVISKFNGSFYQIDMLDGGNSGHYLWSGKYFELYTYSNPVNEDEWLSFFG